MADSQPPPISPDEQRRRRQRVQSIARSLGFVGRVEYRHVARGTGGAQFGLARRAEHDLLVVDARAFERDAEPDECSLEGIIAHERGHQMLQRHSNLRDLLTRWNGHAVQEIMASVIGSLLVDKEKDRQDLMLKAVGEAINRGVDPEDAIWLVDEIRLKLEKWL